MLLKWTKRSFRLKIFLLNHILPVSFVIGITQQKYAKINEIMSRQCILAGHEFRLPICQACFWRSQLNSGSIAQQRYMFLRVVILELLSNLSFMQANHILLLFPHLNSLYLLLLELPSIKSIRLLWMKRFKPAKSRLFVSEKKMSIAELYINSLSPLLILLQFVKRYSNCLLSKVVIPLFSIPT